MRCSNFRKAARLSAVALAFVSAGWSRADDAPPPPLQNGNPPVVAAPAPAPVAGAPAGPPAAAQPKPFAEVIKGAKEIPGYLKLYEKEEKVWMAIKPDQLDKPFFSYNIPRSIGERGYGSQMGDSGMAVFHKIGSNVQLIARNTHYFAKEGMPQAQFVRESFSDSLIASAPVVLQPHADDKAILIEVSALYGDIPGYLTNLETAFRIPYACDAKNTNVESLNNTENNTGIEVQAHVGVPTLSAPPLTPPPVPSPLLAACRRAGSTQLFRELLLQLRATARAGDAPASRGRARRLLHDAACRLHR